MPTKGIENQWLNKEKERLEQELKKLQELKAQILEWNENNKKEELEKINNEILSIEKKLLSLKLEELKQLREQIQFSDTLNESKKLWEQIANLDKRLSWLEEKIESLDNENEKKFAKHKQAIEWILEEIKNDINNIEEKTQKDLSELTLGTIRTQFSKSFIEEWHNPESLITRYNIATSLDKEMTTIQKNDNPITKRSKQAYKWIMNV